MNWTMPYPWRSRRESVRRINMSSEPGNESFFCGLRPIPRILSLRRRDYASQVQIGEPSRRTTISGCSRAPDANRYGARGRCRQQATITGLSKLREWRRNRLGANGNMAASERREKPERSGIRTAWAYSRRIVHLPRRRRSSERITRDSYERPGHLGLRPRYVLPTIRSEQSLN